MQKSYAALLHTYYKKMGIHPENFKCKHQSICRQYAFEGKMTETKMSMVGSHYGLNYPKIVVLSFDPPREEGDVFLGMFQRTTEYIADLHENENFDVNRPNPHWAMTQIIVKDVLKFFGYLDEADSAAVDKSYAGSRIENVSAYFAHVNIAKCSMNNPGRGRASGVVHDTCANAYLFLELMLLEPEILITQGSNANELCGKLLLGRPVYLKELPKTMLLNISKTPTLWMPMFHPARFTHKIRETWQVYRDAVQSWRDEVLIPER